MNLFNPGYYNEYDLKDVGFKSLGNNIQIDKNCTIIGVENIEIGSNVRIDGYCTITVPGRGWLKLGSHIHIGAYCYLSAGDGIHLEDFVGISQGACIYSRTDTYSGYLTGPTVPEKYTNISRGTVKLERHVVIGAGSVILPNISIGEGSAVGALSLVNKSLDAWGVFVGCPAKRMRDRSRKLLELEKELSHEKVQIGAPANGLPSAERD